MSKSVNQNRLPSVPNHHRLLYNVTTTQYKELLAIWRARSRTHTIAMNPNVAQEVTAQEADLPLALDNDHAYHRREALLVARTVDPNRLMQVKKVDVPREVPEAKTNLVHPKSHHHQNHHARKYRHHHHLCQHQNRFNRWKSATWNLHNQWNLTAFAHRSQMKYISRKKQ
jgi:hypothetical protein